MKTVLRVSLIVNLALCGCLVFIWMNHRRGEVIAGEGLPAMRSAISEPARIQPKEEPVPFRWDQLDAKDYHDYVKNLRAIGCPEPTVRAIVTADVDAVYQNYGQQLKRKLLQAESGSLTNQLGAFNADQAMKAELQKMPDEEAAKIADLFGLKAGPSPSAMASAEAAEVAVPLVLQNVDLGALNLNEDQRQVVAGLRQDFLQQIGGTNQDPNDPAYLARWQKAQADADNMLMGMLGNDVYTKYQLMGYQRGLENR